MNVAPQSLIYLAPLIAAVAAFAFVAPARGWIRFPKGRVIATACFTLIHAGGVVVALPVTGGIFLVTFILVSFRHGMPNDSALPVLAVLAVLLCLSWIALTAAEVMLCTKSGIGAAQLRDKRSAFWVASSVSVFEICGLIILSMFNPGLGTDSIEKAAITAHGLSTPAPTQEHPAWDVDDMNYIGLKYVRKWRLGDYNYGQAEVDLSRCDELFRNNRARAEAQAARAAVLTGSAGGETKIWLAQADKALELDPNSTIARGVVGHSLSLQGKDKEAIQEFSKCMQLEPSNPEWLANRALSYEGTGEFPAAIKDYTQFITMVPNECWGYASRAHAYLNSNDFNPSQSDVENALRDLDEGLKLEPENVFAIEHHGVAYIKKGEYARALTDLKRAENLVRPRDPQLVEILGQQAECYRLMGDGVKEKELAARAQKLADAINKGAP
jgi:tetratricopeptide (TPR) repeat protein